MSATRRHRSPRLVEHGHTVGVRLEPSAVARLRAQAEAEGVSLSCLVRRIVHDHFDAQDWAERVAAGCMPIEEALRRFLEPETPPT